MSTKARTNRKSAAVITALSVAIAAALGFIAWFCFRSAPSASGNAPAGPAQHVHAGARRSHHTP